MSNTFGEKLKLTIFGESHGAAIGGVIEGLPAGTILDMERLRAHMARRAPGKEEISTSRREGDQVHILSGYFNDKTTGTPLAFLIENKDTRPADYEQIRYLLRPGHADYTAYAKYKGFHDYRGSGSFSGRITASLNFAGGIAIQILESMGVFTLCHALCVGDIRDLSFSDTGLSLSKDYPEIKSLREDLWKKKLPTLDEGISQEMEEEILKAKEEKDSLGGVIECGIFGLPAGIGEPFFDSIESRLAHICFSVPAIKGIEFGSGFSLAGMRGSKANDTMAMTEEVKAEDINCMATKLAAVQFKSNHNGGILGGISNGLPVVFRACVKPTSSIGKAQQTVNIESMKDTLLKVEGRHDPCIVPRVIPVLESAAAFCILDMLMKER